MKPESRDIELTVNGQRHTVSVAVDETLVTTLRRDFDLMSVRSTCGIGICGVCAVLIDDLPVSACLTLTSRCADRSIVTAEGLMADDETPGRVQAAFIEHSAFQCSFCTPGFVVTADKLLRENPNPDDEDIREYLAGNLCRCGSYAQVLEAVQSLREEHGATAAEGGGLDER